MVSLAWTGDFGCREAVDFQIGCFYLNIHLPGKLTFIWCIAVIFWLTLLAIDILDQVSRPDKCNQRLRVWHERGPQSWYLHIPYWRFYPSTDPNCLLERNELNWFTTYFNIGIIIGGPFFTLALTVIQPRFWLPACTMLWSLFILFIYKAQDAKTVYILRYERPTTVMGLFIWPVKLFCRSFRIRCHAWSILHRKFIPWFFFFIYANMVVCL